MRILFKKGEQKKFLEAILLKISVTDAAELCVVSDRTIRDWRREKFLMNKDAAMKLSQKANICFPKNFQEKDDYWYADPYAGAKASIKKYGAVGGNPKYRKEKWHEWWNTKGRFVDNPLFKRKPIRIPRHSQNLAEFVGIMLGDGHVPILGSQINITLNNKDDADYIEFVCHLIGKLFERAPGVFAKSDKNASSVYISSTSLLGYLLKLGLKRGNKVKLQVDIPPWIKNNEKFSKACIRGLIDTDGCIFTERHKIKDKFYNYKRLNFSNRSINLLDSVFAILNKFGLEPRRRKYSVQIEDKENIEKYFKIIGTSNPKHLKRYNK